MRVVDQLKEMQEDGMILNPLSEALVKGNYRYIYFTTKEAVKSNKVLKTKTNAFVVFETQTKEFFSITWDFYQAAASVVFEIKKRKRKP